MLRHRYHHHHHPNATTATISSSSSSTELPTTMSDNCHDDNNSSIRSGSTTNTKNNNANNATISSNTDHSSCDGIDDIPNNNNNNHQKTTTTTMMMNRTRHCRNHPDDDDSTTNTTTSTPHMRDSVAVHTNHFWDWEWWVFVVRNRSRNNNNIGPSMAVTRPSNVRSSSSGSGSSGNNSSSGKWWWTQLQRRLRRRHRSCNMCCTGSVYNNNNHDECWHCIPPQLAVMLPIHRSSWRPIGILFVAMMVCSVVVVLVVVVVVVVLLLLILLLFWGWWNATELDRMGQTMDVYFQQRYRYHVIHRQQQLLPRVNSIHYPDVTIKATRKVEQSHYSYYLYELFHQQQQQQQDTIISSAQWTRKTRARNTTTTMIHNNVNNSQSDNDKNTRKEQQQQRPASSFSSNSIIRIDGLPMTTPSKKNDNYNSTATTTTTTTTTTVGSPSMSSNGCRSNRLLLGVLVRQWFCRRCLHSGYTQGSYSNCSHVCTTKHIQCLLQDVYFPNYMPLPPQRRLPNDKELLAVGQTSRMTSTPTIKVSYSTVPPTTTNRRRSSSTTIPQIIHQAWDDTITTMEYPELARIQNTWRSMTGYEYHFYNLKQQLQFIEQYYTDQIVPIYESISDIDQRYSVFQLLVLYKMGGVYVNIDVVSEVHLNALLLPTDYDNERTTATAAINTTVSSNRTDDDDDDDDATTTPSLIVVRNPNVVQPHCTYNVLVASVPGHPIIRTMIESTLQQLVTTAIQQQQQQQQQQHETQQYRSLTIPIWATHFRTITTMAEMVTFPIWKLHVTSSSSYSDYMYGGNCVWGISINRATNQQLLADLAVWRRYIFRATHDNLSNPIMGDILILMASDDDTGATRITDMHRNLLIASTNVIGVEESKRATISDRARRNKSVATLKK